MQLEISKGLLLDQILLIMSAKHKLLERLISFGQVTERQEMEVMVVIMGLILMLPESYPLVATIVRKMFMSTISSNSKIQST